MPVTNPVLIFAIVMLVILVAPLVFDRLRIPGLVGLILAGVAAGPHGVGLLERGETMELLGTVGLLYIMFIAGLEVDLNQFSKYRKQSLLFSAFTFGLPQLAGTLAGAWLLGFGWAAAILLGSIIASHTLVAYPLLSRLGLAKNRAVTTSVGATIITDTAALLVLAVVARSAQGELTTGFWVQLLLSLALYLAAVFALLPRIGRWFFRVVEESDGVAGYVFVLAAVFTSAYLAEVAGVEPIIGAFMAGLALNRLVPEQGTLMNRVQFVGESLFIPFFLISVGMLVDLRVFAGGAEAWAVAGMMLGAVLLTKWLAAFATRPLLGYSPDEAWMIFGLTVAQAAATLAAVMVGFELGLLDGNVLNGTILMILVTCLVGPWLAERHGRRVALAEEQKPYEPSEAPERILVAVTSPDEARPLMDLALLLRRARSEEPIYPLMVARSGSGAEAEVAACEKVLDQAARHAAAADVPVYPVTRVSHHVAAGMTRAVLEERITTIILGWNGVDVTKRWIFGHVIDRLLRDSRETLIVTRITRPLNTFDRVVLVLPPYVEREPGFCSAVRMVKTLAGQLGSGLVAISTGDQLPVLERQLARVKPDVPTKTQAMASWSELVRTLDETVKPGDLLVTVSLREGTIAWRPGLNRLPRVLAQRFSEVSQLFLYPSETVREGPAGPIAAPEGDDGRLVAPEPSAVRVGVAGARWEEVAADVLAALPLPGGEHARRAVGALFEEGTEYAPELLPGAALVPVTARGVPGAALHVGISREGLKLPRAASPVHVVLFCLFPEGADPGAQARLIEQVTRFVRKPGVLERLRLAADPEAVRRVFDEQPAREPMPTAA